MQNAIQLSNIVYPSSSKSDGIKDAYGKHGFSRCFDKREKKEVKYKPQIIKEFGEFLTYDSVSAYSPKIKSILDYVINSDGIVFIYTQYYWAGVYPLAIALEHIGFTKYKSGSNSRNMATGITVDNKFSKQRPSYIILSRDKELSPNNDKEIADAKAAANMNGEIIKVVIVTKVGAEGIDFKCIREIHIMEPWFNLNRLEQITGRGIRTLSHIALPKEKRNTTVFFHASTYTPKEESVDIKIYRFAERKQRTINEVQRLLKQGAIDCNLNISNLFYPVKDLDISLNIVTSQGKMIKGYKIGDRDNSYICDYGKCEMQCKPGIDLRKSRIDETTFDPYFIIDDIDLYKKYIGSLYIKNPTSQYTYDDIMKLLLELTSNIEEDVLTYTLQEMLDNKTKITLKNGRQGYLIYRGDTYILQDVKHYETKLTQEERRDLKKRSRLDFDILRLKYKETEKVSSVEDLKTKSEKKKDKSANEDIYVKLQITYNTLKELASPFDIADSVILESMIDKLTFQELEALLTKVVPDGFMNIYKALVSSDIIIQDDKGNPIYVYNHLDSSFYSIQKTGLKRIGPLEQAKIGKSISQVEARIKYTNDNYKGLIEFSKKNEPNFKIRDNEKTKGFVCHQTSSLTLNDLKDRVNALLSKSNAIDKSSKVNKKMLCELYELLLRSRGKELFKRPYYKS